MSDFVFVYVKLGVMEFTFEQPEALIVELVQKFAPLFMIQHVLGALPLRHRDSQRIGLGLAGLSIRERIEKKLLEIRGLVIRAAQ